MHHYAHYHEHVTKNKQTSMPVWPAPTAAGPISGTQQIPGSKSVTNRALILAALAAGPSTIVGTLRSRDTDLMMDALRSLGVDITPADGTDPAKCTDFTITPGQLHGGDVECGLAGTVMRFVPAVAAFAEGTSRFDGDPQARVRPMSTILDALRNLGVEAEGDRLPFTVTGGTTPRGGRVDIDASGSSQFVSGLLLAGARFAEGLEIHHTGDSLPSQPHIDMTMDMLRAAGVTVTQEGKTWRAEPGLIQGHEWVIEPDLSNATPFLAAAAVTGGSVTVPHWPAETTQPGDAIRGILTEMGCDVTLADGALTVTGPADGQLTGIERDMGNIGELTPTVAALAALATTPSRLTGVAHLRGHETDRLAALTAEINALGGHCEELADGLAITPADLHGGTWHSYADHRMATAGSIIGLKVPGIGVEDVETTAKTLPGFAQMWEAMVRG